MIVMRGVIGQGPMLAKVSARAALFNEQRQLLEGEFGARGVHAGDRPGMPRVGIAQVIKRLLRSSFSDSDVYKSVDT